MRKMLLLKRAAFKRSIKGKKVNFHSVSLSEHETKKNAQNGRERIARIAVAKVEIGYFKPIIDTNDAKNTSNQYHVIWTHITNIIAGERRNFTSKDGTGEKAEVEYEKKNRYRPSADV